MRCVFVRLCVFTHRWVCENKNKDLNQLLPVYKMFGQYYCKQNFIGPGKNSNVTKNLKIDTIMKLMHNLKIDFKHAI